jgi:hypothetical protein
MNNYDAKSCSALEKSHYKPIEAALRWCNLIQHEAVILQTTGDDLFPSIGAFPQWPCLRANAEKVYDAILNGELAGGRDGKTVSTRDHVKKERLTIRHTDLKGWMAKHYPDQKPKFLFDEVERTTHAAINADSFRVLQADRDALKTRIEKAIDAYQALRQERDKIEGERASLAAMVEKMNIPGARAETTYLNIIGGLLGLMLGKSPAGKAQSVFDNQSMVIAAMLAHHGHLAGVSDTTLQNKFAEANRSIKST